MGEAPPPFDDEEFCIAPGRFHSLMVACRDLISGPARVLCVFVFEGSALARFYVSEDLPERGAHDRFSQDLHRVWANYDVGSVVPVVLTRLDPPFTGVAWVRLPWGPDGSWCERCGARTEGGRCRACDAP